MQLAEPKSELEPVPELKLRPEAACTDQPQ